jgi:hypothetical protein
MIIMIAAVAENNVGKTMICFWHLPNDFKGSNHLPLDTTL